MSKLPSYHFDGAKITITNAHNTGLEPKSFTFMHAPADDAVYLLNKEGKMLQNVNGANGHESYTSEEADAMKFVIIKVRGHNEYKIKSISGEDMYLTKGGGHLHLNPRFDRDGGSWHFNWDDEELRELLDHEVTLITHGRLVSPHQENWKFASAEPDLEKAEQNPHLVVLQDPSESSKGYVKSHDFTGPKYTDDIKEAVKVLLTRSKGGWVIRQVENPDVHFAHVGGNTLFSTLKSGSKIGDFEWTIKKA